MMRMFGFFVCISTRIGDSPGAASTDGKLLAASGAGNFGELTAAADGELCVFVAKSGDRFTALRTILRLSFAGFCVVPEFWKVFVGGVAVERGCSINTGLMFATG